MFNFGKRSFIFKCEKCKLILSIASENEDDIGAINEGQLPRAKASGLVSSSRSYDMPIDFGTGRGTKVGFVDFCPAFKFFPLVAILRAALRSAFSVCPHALHLKLA
jgi:hypothetical protein